MGGWWGRMETVTDFILLGSRITVDGDLAMKLKDPCSLKERYDKLAAKSSQWPIPPKAP